MRASAHRRVIAICIAGACLAAGLITAAFAASGRSHAAASRPRLLVLRTDPLTVRGVQFARHGRVTVTLILDGMATGVQSRQTRRVRASSVGAFTVRFSSGSGRCTAWTVRATEGRRGSVVLAHGPKPECAPL